MVARAGFNQYLPVALINQKAADGHFHKVVVVAGHLFAPQYFGDYPKHGAAIGFKIARPQRNKFCFHFYLQ
jgi:hypothetical protein